MMLTKSAIPPHDPAIPAPWLALVLRFFRHFSPLPPATSFFPTTGSATGFFNGLHQERKFLSTVDSER